MKKKAYETPTVKEIERPEYVKCVATGREGPEKSWCGREIGLEWCFVDATHAALAAPKSRLVPRPQCVVKIVKSLLGVKVLPDEDDE